MPPVSSLIISDHFFFWSIPLARFPSTLIPTSSFQLSRHRSSPLNTSKSSQWFLFHFPDRACYSKTFSCTFIPNSVRPGHTTRSPRHSLFSDFCFYFFFHGQHSDSYITTILYNFPFIVTALLCHCCHGFSPFYSVTSNITSHIFHNSSILSHFYFIRTIEFRLLRIH